MPQVTNVVDHRRSLKVVTVVASAVVVIAIAGGVFILARNAAAAQQAQQAYASAMNQAQLLDHAGRYSEEQAELTTYMNTNPPKKYQYTIDIKLGDLTYNAHQDRAALGWYQRAEKVNGKPGVLDVLGVAQAAEATGDKATAIKNLREAITLTKQDKVDPVSIPSLVQEYQDEIRALGGTP